MAEQSDAIDTVKVAGGAKHVLTLPEIEEDKEGYRVRVSCVGWPKGHVGRLRVRMGGAIREATVSGGGIGKDGFPAQFCTLYASWPREVGLVGGKEMQVAIRPKGIVAEFEADVECEASLEVAALDFLDLRKAGLDVPPLQEIHHSIAWVRDSGLQTGVNVNQDTYSFASTPSVNNHIIVAVCGWHNTSFDLDAVTDNQTNTYAINSRSDNTQDVSAHSEATISSAKVATASGTFTVTIDPNDASGNYIVWWAAEFSGLDQTTHLHKTGKNRGDGASTDGSVTASAANTNANCLVIAALVINSGDTNLNITTPTSGYTVGAVQQDSDAVIGGSVAWKIVSATETSSATWTEDNNAGDTWTAVIATYQAAAGGAASVTPGVGVGTLTGFAPAVGSSQIVLPGVGAGTFTGFAPAAGPSATVLPGVGVGTFSGFAPNAGPSATVLPDVGTLTFDGFAPAVGASQIVLPGVGAAVLAGFAPTVSAGISASPGVGVGTFTGFAPTLELPRQVIPGLGVLTWTGFAPSVQIPTTVLPGLGVAVWNGFAPVVSTGLAPILFPGINGTVLLERVEAGMTVRNAGVPIEVNRVESDIEVRRVRA